MSHFEKFKIDTSSQNPGMLDHDIDHYTSIQTQTFEEYQTEPTFEKIKVDEERASMLEELTKEKQSRLELEKKL